LLTSVCGAALLLFSQLRSASRRFNWRALVLASNLLLVATGEFYIAPEIAGLRAQGPSAVQAVARLHGVASIACLITSVVGLILVIAGTDSD
jgi:hypothetical protein